MELNILPKDLFNLCLSFLTNNEIIYHKRKWNQFQKQYICNIAAENGWIDLLEWAIKNDCPWDYNCPRDDNGNYRWDNYCTWDTCTYIRAIRNGHLEIIRWAYFNGYKWKSHEKFDIVMEAVESCNSEILKFVLEQI